MVSEGKPVYPRIPVSQWWALRERFKQSMPGAVTPRYVAETLKMQESSAKANVLPALVAAGLVSDDGVTQDRARRWRDDAQYPQVCQEIREALYPAELIDAAPGPKIDRAAAGRWFANATGVGREAAQQMARLYALLMAADPSQSTVAPNGKPAGKAQKRAKQPGGDSHELVPPEVVPVAVPDPVNSETSGPYGVPSLHIDVQIHIPATATSDQIDSIFRSMAAHLGISRHGQ